MCPHSQEESAHIPEWSAHIPVCTRRSHKPKMYSVHIQQMRSTFLCPYAAPLLVLYFLNLQPLSHIDLENLMENWRMFLRAQFIRLTMQNSIRHFYTCNTMYTMPVQCCKLSRCIHVRAHPGWLYTSVSYVCYFFKLPGY